jgi:hypothetical protein
MVTKVRGEEKGIRTRKQRKGVGGVKAKRNRGNK